MMMVDTANRWVYKGSVTTPPCDTLVYWNVLRTVYPIKKKYLDMFQNQLKRGYLSETGNYRNTMPVRKHDIHIITSAEDGAPKSSNPWVIILLVGLIVSLGFSVPLCITNKKLQEEAKKPQEEARKAQYEVELKDGPDAEKNGKE